MASPLHKTPLGLLELFRLKTLGRAPDLFGDTVMPSIDAENYYAAAELQTAGSSTAVGAMNGAGGLGIGAPIANFQIVWGVGGRLVLGAAPGTFVVWEVILVVGVGNAEFCFATGDLRTTAAGSTIQFGAMLPRPQVMRAGSSWVARVRGDAAGADHTINANAMFIPAANLV